MHKKEGEQEEENRNARDIKVGMLGDCDPIV